MRRSLLVALVLAASLLTVGRSSAAPPSIATTPVLSGLASPVLLTSAKDGSDRLFVVEQGGVIRVAQEGSSSTTTFLDITPRVVSGGERGLLGLTFHPNYETNGRFFVNYTRAGDGATVVSEFAVSGNPDVANAESEQVLLEIPQPYENHNGGMIEFGPDGLLYIGMGDGGSGNDPQDRAQNPDVLLGKMLRMNVNVAEPSPEIFALGFRNPWRWSFDRSDGRLLLGDVGQGSREEVDIVQQGKNYGWRVFEGTLCTNNDPLKCSDTSPYTFPIAEYDTHVGGRCAVTGGYVYRGSAGAMPTGTYVFGDFCSGEIFVIDGGAVVALDTGMMISSFGEDEAGEVYVVDHQGSVHRIVQGTTPPPCMPPNGVLSGPINGLGLGPVASLLCSLGL